MFSIYRVALDLDLQQSFDFRLLCWVKVARSVWRRTASRCALKKSTIFSRLKITHQFSYLRNMSHVHAFVHQLTLLSRILTQSVWPSQIAASRAEMPCLSWAWNERKAMIVVTFAVHTSNCIRLFSINSH